MKNKRGQDVSPLPVVISIILLLGVAVVLILGFTKGWQTFAFWLPQNNVQTISTQCNVACTTSNTYDFCTLPRTLNDPTQKGTGDGKAAFDKNGALLVTCNDFSSGTKASLLAGYQIPACSGMTC
jgi:hypothetical protein